MWSHRLFPVINLAAAFVTGCNFIMTDCHNHILCNNDDEDDDDNNNNNNNKIKILRKRR